MEFFSKVDETFEIAGRGCVVVPTIPRASLEFRLRAKDLIQLRTPDGRVLDTYIAGIEMICGSHVREHMAFLLPQNITKQEIPKDTEIWLIRA